MSLSGKYKKKSLLMPITRKGQNAVTICREGKRSRKEKREMERERMIGERIATDERWRKKILGAKKTTGKKRLGTLWLYMELRSPGLTHVGRKKTKGNIHHPHRKGTYNRLGGKRGKSWGPSTYNLSAQTYDLPDKKDTTK